MTCVPPRVFLSSLRARKNPVRGNISILNYDRKSPTSLENSFHTSSSLRMDIASPGLVRGIDRLRDPKFNKGMGFTLEERIKLGIHGLLPPTFKTLETQVAHCKLNFDRYSENLNKYIYLVELMERNEKLFYRLLTENIEEMMPIVYTPTVGLACQKFGLIYRRAHGLFLTIHDKGHIYEILHNWPEPNVRAIVVTDGERILGLGDLGAYGMGIPVGKLALYTALAGIKPSQCLPIVLDVGTNSKHLIEDPLYIGLKHERITGVEYDELLDEFMEAVTQKYGQDTLVQFEDFGNFNAFRLLEKYRHRYCTFNDDIQGTAAVAVAGLLASVRITKKKITDNTVLFCGAGGAALGIAELLVMAMVAESGISPEEAKKKIWMSDADGLMVNERKDIPSMSPLRQSYLKNGKLLMNIEEMVDSIKPDILIGACTVGGMFNANVLKKMAMINERPIVFALSNPTSNAECTAEEAYTHTDGRVIFASGSPFPPVVHKGKTYVPGQGNNAYIFPGVALGILSTGMHHVGDEIFLLAAQTLAGLVKEEDLATGRLYPPLSTILECSVVIAKRISEYSYEKDLANTYPEPEDKEAFIRSHLYDLNYGPAQVNEYKWPDWV